jgi:hypothetical protein
MLSCNLWTFDTSSSDPKSWRGEGVLSMIFTALYSDRTWKIKIDEERMLYTLRSTSRF